MLVAARVAHHRVVGVVVIGMLVRMVVIGMVVGMLIVMVVCMLIVMVVIGMVVIGMLIVMVVGMLIVMVVGMLIVMVVVMVVRMLIVMLVAVVVMRHARAKGPHLHTIRGVHDIRFLARAHDGLKQRLFVADAVDQHQIRFRYPDQIARTWLESMGVRADGYQGLDLGGIPSHIARHIRQYAVRSYDLQPVGLRQRRHSQQQQHGSQY